MPNHTLLYKKEEDKENQTPAQAARPNEPPHHEEQGSKSKKEEDKENQTPSQAARPNEPPHHDKQGYDND